jgi:ERCC4-type nuclease
MLVRYDLKKASIDELLKNIVVLYAKNEQDNSHIIKYFDRYNIKHKAKTMKTCDYSFEIQPNDIIGNDKPLNFENIVLVERKAHLTELAGNIGKVRLAFENEFIRSISCKNVILMIEDGSYNDINSGNYEYSFLNKKSFYNTLLSWSHKYNFKIDFVTKEISAKHILMIFKMVLKKYLEE